MKRRGSLGGIESNHNQAELYTHELAISCTIIIASPDFQVRKRWGQALGNGYAVLEISEFTKLKAIIGSLKPSIVLFDSALSERRRSSNVLAITQLSPVTKIIVLSSVINEKEQVMMLEIGARGYCNIDIDPVLLKKAVQVVQKGEIWVGRSVISSLVQKLTARRESLHKHSDTDALISVA